MQNNQWLEIDACSSPTGIIYDNGGPSGNYSDYFTGGCVIVGQPGITITLQGEYNTESGYDKISVYDGFQQSGTLLVNEVSGNGSIDVSSQTGYLSLYFHTDGSSTRSGFALSYSTSGSSSLCINPLSNLTITSVTSSSAQISWNATDPQGPFTVILNGIAQSTNTNSLSLSGLNPNTLYDVTVVNTADNASPCCVVRSSFRTQCGVMTSPLVENFDDHGIGVVPSCWVRQKNYDDPIEERYPQTTGVQYASAPASLMMFCGSNNSSGHYSLAIGPEISDDITTLYVRFKMRCANVNAQIEVGVCDDTTLYDNHFTPVDTFTVGSANTWEEKVASFASYAGSGRRIAFRMIRSLQPGNSLVIYLDDLSIEPCGVWHIERRERGIDGFWVYWDLIGNPTVDVEIGPQGFLPGSGTLYSNVTAPFHFTGLEPATTYQLRFYSTCAGIMREQTGLNAATLDRDEQPVNICEGFETGSTALPEGWRKLDSYNNSPQPSTSYYRSGNRSLWFNPRHSYNARPVAVMPRIDTLDIDQLSLSFMLRSSYDNAYIEVGVMEYPEYSSSFVPVDTVNASTMWSLQKVSLASYTGNGRYIAFRAYETVNNSSSIYLDELQVGPCLVTGATVTNIAAHRVELRWDTVDAFYPADSVTVEYGPEGFVEGEGTLLRIPVSGTQVQLVEGKQRMVINGLEADSTYDFIVYGDCPPMVRHCVFSRLTAHTLEADIPLPYCQQFDGYATGGLPAGWSRPRMNNNCPRIWNDTYRSGNRSLQMNSSGNFNYNNYSLVVMPLFDVDSVSGMTVSFYTYGNSSYYSQHLQVGVMDDPNDETTFTPVAICNPVYQEWSSHVVDLTPYTGTGRYIAFRNYHDNCNGCSYSANIDDIVVSDAATANRSTYSVTSHGASFKWQGIGRAYSGAVIEWGPEGFVPGTGHRDTVAASAPVDAQGFYHHTLDTLQPGTLYHFFITALSSHVDNICDYTRQSFTTFDQSTAASYCKSFEEESNDSFPEGWTRPETHNNSPIVSGYTAHSGSRSLYFYSYNCGTPHHACAVMPYLEETTLDGLTLSFWAYGSGSQTHLAIGMTTDPNSSDTFDTLAVFPVDHWGSWQKYTVNLEPYSGAGRHIVFRWATANSCYSGELFIDDITLNRCRINDVSSYSPTTTSFTVRWTTEGAIDNVDMEYGPAGFLPGSGTTLANVTSPLTISGLQPSTDYDYYLIPHCTGSSNSCSEFKYSVSTLPAPVAANWCEDFEGYGSYARPNFWTVLQGFESHPFIWNHSDMQYCTSPINAFEFRCAPSGGNVIVMPCAEEPVSDLVLSFNIRCSDPSAPELPSLIVGVMTLPYDTNTFVAVDTLHPSFHYRPVSVDFSSYTGSGRHIAFRYKDDNGGYRYTYIDDLVLSHSRVSDLHATAVGDTSVTLSWNRLGYSDTTWIAYDTLENTTPTNLQAYTSTSHQFHPLLAGRTYHFYLWASGQDTSRLCQALPIAVTTLESPMTVPVCDGFEDYAPGSVPQGWTFPVDVADLGVSNYTNYSGMRNLKLPVCGGSLPRIPYAVMPQLPNDDISSLYFDAWMYSDNGSNDLTLGVMTDPNDTTTFTPVQTFTSPTANYRHIKCSLASYSGTGKYIAFRGSSTDSYLHYIYLDDINLRTCAVTQARATTPTETSITLQWATNSTPQQVYVEYKATGSVTGDFNPGTGTLELVTDNPHTFTGLEEATWYTFHVYPVCDGNYDGCNYETTMLQTLHPWVDLSYCENFESISDPLPNNWLNLSSPNNPQRYQTSSGHNETLSWYTRLTASANDSVLFVLPRIYLGSQCPILDRLYANFWTLFEGNASQALLEVGTMSDANDPATFTPHDTVTPNTGSWQHNILTIDNYDTESQYVAFRLRSLDGSWVYCSFDDLCMEKCVAANVAVSDVTQNSVTITWDNYSVDTLICEYGPAGYQLGNGTVITITESPYILTGLSDGSEYEFTFASLCGCDQYGTAYTPSGGSWGGSGWGGWGWGWWCCRPCEWDPTHDCRYWRWGSWHGHSWSWWYSQSGSGNWVTPPVIDIVTQAAILETPYCESFELSDTVAFPPSWRRQQDSHYPDIRTSSRHTGDKSLRFYATPGSYAYAALPPLEMGTTSSMVLTFYAYSTNSYAVGSTARMAVGVMSNPDDINTFVPLDTIRLDQIANWQQFAVSFASYTGEGQYLAFKFSPVGGAYNMYIDDLYVGPCAITDATTVSSGSNVTVSWTTHNTPDRILVQYGPQGSHPVDADSLFRSLYFTSSPALVSIDPDSSYDFYVSAICNDTATGSCLSEPLTVNPSLLLAYCEDFDGYENGLVPDRWKVVQRNNSRTQYPLTETQHGDHQILAFYPGTGSNNIVCLLPPLTYGDSLAGKWINVILSSSSSSYIYLDFGYLTDTNDATTFVQMASIRNTSTEQLQEFNQQLESIAGNGNRLAVRARSTSGDRWIRLDRISLSSNPSPMNISYTAHGAASRTYRWNNALPYYTVTYGYGDQWQQTTSDSCSVTLTGLQPDHDYEIHFTAPDGETLCIPYQFHNERQISLPYCENFESHDTYSLPAEWTRANSWTTNHNYPRVENYVWYYSPFKSIQFYNNCGSNRWNQITLSDIDIDSIRHLSMRFQMTTDYTDNNNFMIVGVQDIQDDPNTFTPVDTLFGVRNWHPYTVTLSSYGGNGRYITFRYKQTNGNCHYAYIDDLEISACPLPDFTVAGGTVLKATVTSQDPVDYYIEYAEGSFTQGQMDTLWNNTHTDFTLTPHSTVVHVTENPFYLTHLETNTSYTLYTRCDEDMFTCAAPVTISTATQQPLPYCESFDSYESGENRRPAGWYTYNAYYNDSRWPYIYNGYTSSCCNSLHFYNYGNHAEYAALPDIDIDSIRHADLSFWMYAYSNCNDNRLVVGVMDNPYDLNTFTPVDTLECTSANSYQTKYVRLSRYHGDGRFIAFRYLINSNSWRELFIDDIRIQRCPQPTATLSHGTTVKFEVDTSLFAPDYWIEYGPQGMNQMAEDTVWNSDSSAYTLQPRNALVHVTETPFFLTGLNENTTYDFYSRCDSAIATCAPAHRVTTSRVMNLPYCEDFDSYGSGDYTRPTGWYTYNAYYNDSRWPYIYNGYTSSCCNSLHFYNYGNYAEYAALPDIDIDSIRHADFSFWMYAYSNCNDNRLVVGVMDNPYNLATFTPVDTLECTSANSYQTKHVRLSRYHGDGRFIAFRYLINSNSWRELFIDDIRIQRCPQPTATLSHGTTVKFEVDTSLFAPDYWIEYGPQGINQMAEDTVWNSDSSAYTLQPRNTLVHVTENPYYISGLAPGATYDFYCRCDSAVATCQPVQRLTTSTVFDIPSCHINTTEYPNNTMPPYWRRYSNDNYSYYPYLYDHYLYFYRASSNTLCQAVMPDFDIDSVKHLNLTFSITSDYVNDGLVVGIMTDPDNPSTFTPVDTVRTSQTGVWQQVKPRLYRYNGDGRFVALRQITTGTYHRVGAWNFYVESCDIPANVTASLHGNSTVRFDADNPSRTGFLVEYGPQGFVQGSGSLVIIDHLPFDLDLDNNTPYDFYFRCDSLNNTCRPKQSVTTLGPPAQLPLCETFESYSNNNLPTSWNLLRQNNNYGNVYVYNNNAHGGSRSLTFYCYYNYKNYAVLPDYDIDSLKNIAMSFWLKGPSGSSITVGAMSDPNDISSFVGIQTVDCLNDEYHRYQVTFNSLPTDARYITFRSNTPNSCCSRYLYLDDLYIDTVGAANFHVAETESDYIAFEWGQVGTPAMTVEYGPLGFTRGSGTTTTVTSSPFILDNLDPLTNYIFYFDAISQPGASDPCNTNYHDSATVFTPAGGTGCIDPTNFTADYTTCLYGTFSNPYANTGIVNYGYDDIQSRHAVHFDTADRDPRTGGLLRVVPVGASASVRLGNWSSNSSTPEGEAITYSLFVDTTSFDLLILKYAAVLQDPMHDPTEQPRFSLDILDTNGVLIDAQCGAANFIANRALGWNEAADNVLWKDWTTVGVDMSAYAGQTVFIRLTTRDCGEGSHYGYAYFTLDCMMKNMRSELCGNVDSNTFYAPAGFAYRWWKGDDTNVTVSTEQSIKVATENVSYYCQCSFVDNTDCQFTISAYAGTRYPLASFDYTVDVHDCKFHVTFNNTSTISADGVNPIGTGEPCETAWWDFGNGETTNSYNATEVYDSAGTYTVNLTVGIANNQCTHNVSIPITLAFPATNHSLTGTPNICLGDTAQLHLHGAATYTWNTGWSDTMIHFVPAETQEYRCYIADSNGCPDTLRHTVHVYPVSFNHVYETVTENELPFVYNGNSYSDDALDTLTLTNFVGCDSVVYLDLHVYRNVTATTDSTVCEGALPFSWNDSIFTTAATKTTVLHTVGGADSTLTMTLHVIPSTYSTYYDTVVENNLPHSYMHHTYSNITLNDTLHIVNAAGCDSIVTYNLYVHYNVSGTAEMTLCERMLPFTWNDSTFFAAGDKQTTLTAHTGADSTITMTLHVIPTTYSTVYDTVTENALPHTFLHHSYSTDTAGDTLMITNVAGCDSIVTYHLYVHRNVSASADSTICESELPFIWNDSLFTGAGTKSTTFTAHTGADSTLLMTLHVTPTTYGTYYDTVVENNLPHTFLHHSYTSDTAGDTLMIANVAGCDSVVSYHLYVHRNLTASVDSTLCEGMLPFTWNDSLFTTAGTKTTLLHTAAGADSLLAMTLHVIPTTYGTYFDTVVENGLPHTFHHHTYSTDTLGDTLHIANAAGCDSIVTYHLYVHRNVTASADSTLCESELPFIWNDSLFTGAGTKSTTFTAHTGADSTLLMTLHVTPTTYGTYYDTVVENNLPHTFLHHSYTSDTAGDTLMIANVAGCDSVVSYHLYVHRNVTASADSTLCEGMLPFTWNDSLFTTAGVKTTLLHTVAGADSLLAMTLHVIPTTYGTYFDTVVENELPHTFHHHTYSTDTLGDTLHITNAAGCDSIVTYHLYVHRNVSASADSTICSSQLPFTWNDSIFTAAGIKQTPLAAHTGADSVLTMVLNVLPSYLERDTLSLCDNQMPFTWRDTLFDVGSQDGLYNRQHTTVDNCDSICTLQLYVHNTYLLNDTLALCQDAFPYDWRDTVLQTGTVASDHLLHRASIHGCDSIMTLSLTVHPIYSQADNVTLCDNGFPYHWRDTVLQTGTTSGTYNFHRTTAAGCDSAFFVTLTVNPTDSVVDIQEHCDSYHWQDGNDYTTSTNEPAVTYPNRYGCDSVVHLQLTLHYADTGIDSIRSCEDIVWIDGNTYSGPTATATYTISTVYGCDSVVTLMLTKLEPTFTQLTDSFCTGTTYLFGNRILDMGGTYVDTLKTVQNCDSVVTLELTQLNTPTIFIETPHDCDTRSYHISATSNVDYYSWTCEGHDWNNEWGSEHGRTLVVTPAAPLTFTLLTDYHDYPTCPNTASVTLYPIVQPEAVMQVTPPFLTYDSPTLTALSQSSGATQLQWYVDDDDAGNEPTLQFTPPTTYDSVVVTLIAYNEYCADTTVTVVPYLKETLYAPNAFTPDETSNNRFFIYCDGIIQCELSIYTRQGIMIYHSTDLQDSWDGTYKGKACLQDSYVWILNYRSEIDPQNWHTAKGTVTLIR